MPNRSDRDPKAGPGGRVVADGVVLRFGEESGARARRAGRGEEPAPKPRPAPPPEGPFPEVVDRIDAIDRAGTALVAGRPVLFHGPPGVGKTTLLKHLSRTAAHDAPDGAGAWPDGTVLLAARGVPPEDLLQALHRALHASDAPYRATPRQIDNGLRERQALVLIDDLDGDAAGIERILRAAPACAFALATETDPVGVDLVRVPLAGLEADPAVELFVRAWGRDPSPLEAARIREIQRGLGGHPLRLLQAAALTWSGAADLEGIVRDTGGIDPEGALAERLEASLGESRLRALKALEAVAPASLSVEDAAAIAELDEPAADLEALAHRGLARVEDARYRAAGGLGAAAFARDDRETWRDRALDHLAAGARNRGKTWPDAGSVDALLGALDRAVEKERWGDAVAIARAVGPALAVEGLWAAWGEVLERALDAARAADDRAGEAWALHERGSKALAEDEIERAVHDLERAVEIRDAIGDDEGAAASRRNLAVARGDAAAVASPRRGRRRSTGPVWAALAVALVVIAAVALFVLQRGGEMDEVVDAGTVRFEQSAVGDESLAPVAIANDGTGPAEVGPASLAGARPSEFEIVRDACSGSLVPPGERCWIVVAFRPEGVGDRTARLTVPFEEGPSRAVTLSGLGVPGTGEPSAAARPPVAVAPSRVDFGEQPVAAAAGPLPLAIANRGEGTARVAVRIEPAGGPFSIASDVCSNAPLAPGEACVVEIGFRPTGPGLETATAVVRDLGTSDATRVTLTGSGEGAPAGGDDAAPDAAPDTTAAAAGGLVAATGAVDFGEVPAGTRSDTREVVVENGSDAAVDVSTVRLSGLDAAVFTIVEDRCSGRLLTPGGTCTIRVAFEPAEAGGWSARLEIRDSTAEGPDVALEGSGG